MYIFEFEKKPAVNIKNLKQFTDDIRKLLGTTNKPYPKISIDDGWSLSRTTNGDCRWQPGGLESIIRLNRNIMYDMRTAQRVLAHELCHDADNLLNWNPLFFKLVKEQGLTKMEKVKQELAKEIYSEKQGHGTSWFALAAKVNSVYGDKFINQYSDSDYVYNPKYF